MLASPSRNPEILALSSSSTTMRHSCALCRQRKVKCDKQNPCSNCVKARAECVPSAPSRPGRQRRRRVAGQDLAAKLRRSEQLLKRHGISLEDQRGHDNPPGPSHFLAAERGLNIVLPRNPETDQGILFADHQNSRYLENPLWENLRDEIQDQKRALQTSSDDETQVGIFPHPDALIFGHGSTSHDLVNLHPPLGQIFRLWQIFLVNVNPVVKIFHAPTIQQIILDASGDLKNISRPTEALMFAIYLLAITSSKNEECEGFFKESKESLLSKYSYATQQALNNARFLKSLSLSSLQALVIYLLALRRVYDSNSFWILTGVAIRISQRLGIHRDGTSHAISPFDAEMRRRTWWQVVFLDGQASKLAGSGFPVWSFDTKMPLNLSDSDLSPDMKESPVEKEGATEMMFCCLQYEVADALRKSGTFSIGSEQCNVVAGRELIAEKDKGIFELEKRFQQKYIRYCDLSIPLHFLAVSVAKKVISMMKLLAHHPRQYQDKGASMPLEEKNMLFTESLNLLELSAIALSNKLVEGFQWHIHVHFPLDAFIYILSELRHRTTADQVDRAWVEIQTIYAQRPEMLEGSKNSLHFALGNLTLKAWATREEFRRAHHGPHPRPPPHFISVLRSQRNIPEPPWPRRGLGTQDAVATTSRADDFVSNEPPEYNAYEPWRNTAPTFDMFMPDITAFDWEYWQTLMDGDLPTYDDFSGNAS